MHKTTHQSKKIVGVVGAAASGKNKVADIFAENGYFHVSSSDKLREEIASRGLLTSRELQTAIANEMRASAGLGYWVDISLLDVPEDADRIVVSGIYSVGEGLYLRQNLGGLIVGVTVADVDNPASRYRRLIERSEGDRDNISEPDFLAANQRENSGTELYETNVAALVDMADYVITNSSTLDFLNQQTLAVIQQIGVIS